MPDFLFYALSAVGIIWTATFVRKDQRYESFIVGAWLIAFLVMLVPATMIESWIRPLTWDGNLAKIDNALHLNGFWLGRLDASSPIFHHFIRAIYDALPIAFAFAWIVDRSKLLLRSVVIAGILGFALYLLVPACGPRYAIAGYPFHPAFPSGSLALDPTFARNCFPSLHLAWAMLFALNARIPAWKAVLFVYAGLIAVATIAVGEHYVVDLIAAVPFAYAVQWLAERNYQAARFPSTDSSPAQMS